MSHIDPILTEIFSAIKEQKILMEDFAEKTGIACSTMRRWKRGERSPDLFMTRVMAQALGLELMVKKKK